jgi:hypothetical protein
MLKRPKAKEKIMNTDQNKCDENAIEQDKLRIENDKKEILEAAERLAKDEEKLKHDEKCHQHPVKYVFFLDGIEFKSETSSINGADVRAKLPPEKAGYSIFLESKGSEPDKQITDAEAFSLEKGPLCFYSVPPATFGLL